MGTSAQPAASDPERTRFTATVEAVDGRDVWLSESYFYAESGGQPADRGTIADRAIAHVRLADDAHATSSPTPNSGSGSATWWRVR
jgi:alanyl-tRNA synthetase